MMVFENLIFLFTAMSRIPPFPQGNNGLGIVVLKFRNHFNQTTATVSRLKGLRLHYSKTGV
jgi:hypothetical protein